MTNRSDVWLTAREMCDRLASGDTTSVALLGTRLDRIASIDPQLHAFIDVYVEDALSAAAAADAAREAGHAVGPLHGIPVAVKDIIHMRGRITTGGCKVWNERVSETTATLVERMLGAGMIVIGKTHTVEFAMGSFGTNQHMGSPRNPWDAQHHRATGGSSAGSAAAVAAGMVPWAIGTDTGGSVRIPAAWCGLTGLKTTVGRISCHGVMPLSTTLDTPGPICRSVDDAATLYRVLTGVDSRDPRTAFTPTLESSETFAVELDRGVAGLRLAIMPATERDGVDPEVLQAFDASIECLEGLGARVEEVMLPESFNRMGQMTGEIIGTEGYHFVGALVDDPALPIDDDVRPRIQLGRDLPAQIYYQRLRDQRRLRAEFDAALAGFDALLTPTVASPAPRVADIDQSGTAAGFTRPFNLTEYCALALPNGRTRDGLPTSLQIACGSYQELMALRIGGAYQRASDWHLAHPDLSSYDGGTSTLYF